MKSNIYLRVSMIALLALVYSCNEDTIIENEEILTEQNIPEQVLLKIKELGFNNTQVTVFQSDTNGTGYIVEGDIILFDRDLELLEEGLDIRIAELEQYRTTLVPTFTPRIPRGGTTRIGEQFTILLTAGFPQAYVTGLNEAVTRFNNANLGFRIAAGVAGTPAGNTILNARGGPDITIRFGSNFAAAGFPFRGPPGIVTQNGVIIQTIPGAVEIFNEILINPAAINSTNTSHIATIIAHEIGHCIGLRHTNHFNRRPNCGVEVVNGIITTGNEDVDFPNTFGAIHIPGTPTGEESSSFMTACIGSNQNRPFTANDLVALRFLHPL